MQHEMPLRLVEEIARAGSIRAAAEAMAITPSALNRRLLSLEDELETQLFERLPYGVALNAAGEIFIAHARRQLAEMKTVRSKIADIKGARRGRVVVAFDDNVKAGGAFAREVGSYQRQFPAVSFAIEKCPGHKTAAMLSEYRADLALHLHPKVDHVMASLAAAPAQIAVLLRPGHPCADTDEVRLHMLVPYPWMLPSQGQLRSVLETAAQRQGLPFQVGIEATSSFVEPIIMGSDAVGFEVDTHFDTTPRDGLQRRRLAARDYPAIYIHLAQLRGRSLSVAAGRFAEQMKKSYALLNGAD